MVAPAATVVGLAGFVALLVTATPGFGDALTGIDARWIVAAVALEAASKASFVVVFRAFFDRLEARDARALAWSSLASAALLPAGGVGGAAVGSLLARTTGAPTAWVLRRFSGLFFLTSAVNVLAVLTAGLLLLAGAPGPHDFARSVLPMLVAATATLGVVSLAALVRRRRATRGWIVSILDGIRDAQRAARRPSPRLLGALGYLAFDIAVLATTLAAVGEHVPAAGLVLAYLIGYLGGAVPLPGGAGALDAGLVGGLVLYGADPSHATAAVLAYHAIALWVPSLGGLYGFVRLRPRLRAARAAHWPAAAVDRSPAPYDSPNVNLEGQPA
jgi:uncharacterized membrane protein YbhN (UPF0104 family)